LRLRIGDRSKIGPVLVAGLRSLHLKLRGCGFHPFRPALSSRPLPWVLFFVLALAFLPDVRASSDSSAKTSPASAWSMAQSDPRALVRAAIENEINNSYGRRPPIRYLFRKRTRNLDTTKEIVETSDGGVARMVAIRNQPLTPAQTQAEIKRLRELASDPAAQRHRSRGEQKDAARVAGIMHVLPEAFLNRFAGSVETPNGPAIRLTFTPNPNFSPPTLESRILTGIRGEIWIDPTDLRVVRIEGHLFRTVDYGWGILGTLHPGGTISIEQARTPERGWQLAHLSLHLTGKALMFKPLNIVVDETATDYYFVPKNWKFTNAIDWLIQMPTTPPAQVELPQP